MCFRNKVSVVNKLMNKDKIKLLIINTILKLKSTAAKEVNYKILQLKNSLKNMFIKKNNKSIKNMCFRNKVGVVHKTMKKDNIELLVDNKLLEITNILKEINNKILQIESSLKNMTIRENNKSMENTLEHSLKDTSKITQKDERITEPAQQTDQQKKMMKDIDDFGKELGKTNDNEFKTFKDDINKVLTGNMSYSEMRALYG